MILIRCILCTTLIFGFTNFSIGQIRKQSIYKTGVSYETELPKVSIRIYLESWKQLNNHTETLIEIYFYEKDKSTEITRYTVVKKLGLNKYQCKDDVIVEFSEGRLYIQTKNGDAELYTGKVEFKGERTY